MNRFLKAAVCVVLVCAIPDIALSAPNAGKFEAAVKPYTDGGAFASSAMSEARFGEVTGVIYRATFGQKAYENGGTRRQGQEWEVPMLQPYLRRMTASALESVSGALSGGAREKIITLTVFLDVSPSQRNGSAHASESQLASQIFGGSTVRSVRSFQDSGGTANVLEVTVTGGVHAIWNSIFRNSIASRQAGAGNEPRPAYFVGAVNPGEGYSFARDSLGRLYVRPPVVATVAASAQAPLLKAQGVNDAVLGLGQPAATPVLLGGTGVRPEAVPRQEVGRVVPVLEGGTGRQAD